MKKRRIDIALVERGFFETREKARRAIMAGEVFVGTARIAKGSHLLAPGEEAEISLAARDHAVSRAYYKLKKAFETFGLSAQNRIAIDVGASTGGFTQYLLEQGARLVYAVDCGTNQLAYSLRQDARVVVMEKTNARYVARGDLLKARVRSGRLAGDSVQGGGQLAEDSSSETAVTVEYRSGEMCAECARGGQADAVLLEPMPDLGVMDVSFISAALILPQLVREFPLREIVLLVKPQFEAGRNEVSRGGIVREATVHRAVLRRIADAAEEIGFPVCALTHSPIKGSDGNIEFLALLRKNGHTGAESCFHFFGGEAVAQNGRESAPPAAAASECAPEDSALSRAADVAARIDAYIEGVVAGAHANL